MIWWNDPVWGLKYDRQITTLDTIEAYARSGIDFFQPERYWTSHWEQFYVLELSIYQALSAWVSGFTDTVLSASRATNLFFTLLTLPAIFQITATYFCRKTAAYAVVFYSFAPLNLMYQAATLIDVSTTFFATTAYWMLVQYFKGNKSITVFFVFFLAGACCVVTKPLYFLPSGVLLITHFFQQRVLSQPKKILDYIINHRGIIGAFTLITLITFLWLAIQSQLNTTSHSKLNASQFLSFYHVFDLLFYLRIIFRWMLVVLNPVTFLFFILGVLLFFRDHLKCERIALVYSIFAYHLIFGAMVTPHEYYLLVMVPFASIIAGLGARWIEEKIQDDFRIRPNYTYSAAISLVSVICSVLIFSINFVSAQDIEQRSTHITKEMNGVLKQGQYAFIYADRNNFPLHDYVVYNRTAKLKYFMGLISKEQIRVYSDPVRPTEILSNLKIYGHVQLVLFKDEKLFINPEKEIILELDVEKAQTRYQGHLRYLMFYRFTETAKLKIRNRIEGHKLIYRSDNWLVYDLAPE